MKSCTVILAGGMSTRMGMNKALLPLQDKPVVEYIIDEMKTISDSVIINTNIPEEYTYLGLPIISDNYPNDGPLAGMEAALAQVEAEVYYMCACDTPFVNRSVYNYLFEQLKGYEAVVPIYRDKMHPLSGIYRRSILPKLRYQLENEQRRVRLLFDYIAVNYVHSFRNYSHRELKKHFFNMNNPKQYEQAKRF